MVFVCLNAVIQTLGTLLDFQIASKIHLPSGSCILRFRQVSQHSAHLDHSIQTRESNKSRPPFTILLTVCPATLTNQQF